MRGFLRVLLFVVVGPFIGLVVFALCVGFSTLITKSSTDDFAFGALLDPQILLITYTMGGGPALIDGVFATIIARRVTGWPYWGWVTLFGAGVSVAIFLLLGMRNSGLTASDALGIAMVAGSGGIAGFVCALLFDALSAAVARAR